jgi:membrane fusion protein, multidrug efflux system
VPRELNTFGSVQPFATVAIKPQVSEVLKTTHFQKGDTVKKGQLLFSIDPRPFQIALEQAQANLARDTAQAEYARKTLKREEDLFKRGVSSKTEYEKAEADAAALDAALHSDATAIDNAKLNIEYCSVHSPIDGRAGNILVDEGNLVKANESVLVTLNQIRPIEVSFAIPQGDLPAVRKRQAESALRVDAVIPKEDGIVETGQLTFIDNTVDKSTGTILLSATFPNEKERLWPGQYVQVRLILEVDKNAIVVPSKAVQIGRDGKYVFVVKPDMTVESRGVTADRTQGDLSVVTAGIDVGEQVVTDGQVRLTPGAKVQLRASGAGPNGDTTAPASAQGRGSKAKGKSRKMEPTTGPASSDFRTGTEAAQ